MRRKKSDKHYILNRETLDYDVVEQPSVLKRSLGTALIYAASSAVLFVLSLFLFTGVFHLKTPKLSSPDISNNLYNLSGILITRNAPPTSFI